MPSFLSAYSGGKEAFILKKLFSVTEMLVIKQFEQIRFDGSYSIEQISAQQYECRNERFQIIIEAEEISVQHLFETGFLVTCKSLKKILVERVQK